MYVNYNANPSASRVGDYTVAYPLLTSDCKPVTASSLRNRTKYSTRVSTTATGGSFVLLGHICNMPNNDLRAIDGTAMVITAMLVEEVCTM